MDSDSGKLRYITTLVICVVTIAVVGTAALFAVSYFLNRFSPHAVSEYRDQAFAEAEKHHYGESEKIYRAAIDLAKTNVDAHGGAESNSELAKVYAAEGDHAKAIPCLLSALAFYQPKSAAGATHPPALSPDGVAVLLQLAQAYAKNKQPEEARSSYKDVLSQPNVSNLTDETRNQATKEYGALLRSMGLRMEAEQVDIDLAAADDDIGSINDKMRAGMQFFIDKKYPQAEKAFRTVLALGKNRHQSNRIAQALIWAGKAEVAERKYPEAESSFEEASSQPALIGEPAELQATALSMRAFSRFCLQKEEMPDLVKNALALSPTILNVDCGWVQPISEAYMSEGNTEGAILLRQWRVSQLQKFDGTQSLPAVHALYELSEFERLLGKGSSQAHAKDARSALNAMLAKTSGGSDKADDFRAYELLSVMDDQANLKADATAALRKGLACFKPNDVSVDKTRLLISLSEHLDFANNKSQRHEAEEALRTVLKIIEPRQDKLALPGEPFFRSHRLLAELMVMDNNLPEARANLAVMAPAYQQFGRRQEAAISNLSMEKIHDKSFDRARLLAAADQVVSLISSRAPTGSEPLLVASIAAHTWTIVADVYADNGELAKSIPCYKQAELFCKNLAAKQPVVVIAREHYQSALNKLAKTGGSADKSPSASGN